VRSRYRYLGILAGGGITFALLTPFAPTAQAACTPPVNGACGDTAVTFAVTGGGLAISVPGGTVDLGGAAPGATSAAASLGTVQVADTRGADLVWHCRVQATNLTSSGKPDIPATGGHYVPGTITTDNGTASGTTSTDLSASTDIASHATGTGNSTSSWNPNITWIVPLTAQAGTYTGTVTHSVSPT